MSVDAAARIEIHDLLARSAHALDPRDLALLETCFAPDATRGASGWVLAERRIDLDMPY